MASPKPQAALGAAIESESGGERLIRLSAERWRVDLDGWSAEQVLTVRRILHGLYRDDSVAEGQWMREAQAHGEPPEAIVERLIRHAGLGATW